MKRTQTITRTLVLLASIITLGSVAQAQSTRTFVSGVGDDINPCSRTAPCKTFAGAISKTATNGYINVLDPGGYGALTITKSITVDGGPFHSGVLHGLQSGFSINFDSFQAADTRKAVVLRNLQIEGGASSAANSGLRGVRITGGAVNTGGSVRVESCFFEGAAQTPGRGVEDARTGGGELFVSNSTFQNLFGTAISHASTTATRVDWTINNVEIFNCSFGIAIGSGARATISNSVIAGCTNAGLFAEGPTGAAEMHVENTVSNNNGTGVQNNAGGTIRLSNSTITNNGTGVTGATLSYGNNKIGGNTLAGTTPTITGQS